MTTGGCSSAAMGAPFESVEFPGKSFVDLVIHDLDYLISLSCLCFSGGLLAMTFSIEAGGSG